MASGGVLQIGKHIDFHDNSGETTVDHDLRLSCTATGALSCGGTFTAAGLTSSAGLSVTSGTASLGALSASTGTFTGVVSRLQHHVQAYASSAANIPVSAFPTLLPLNATQAVRGTNGFNTTTKRFTAPVDGMYLVAVRWQCLTTSPLTTQLTKNGVGEATSYSGRLTHVLYLTTSDYLEVLGSHPDSVARGIYTGADVTSVTFTLL